MNYLRYFLILFFILFFVLFFSPIHALTLGNVKVNSFINQKLDANIEILSLGDVDPTKIRAFLASKEDFIKFEVDRSDFLRDIRFVTYQEESGKTYIHLTTQKVIREPLISLIVNIRTVEGNLSREYNLFLNPSPDTRIKSKSESDLIFSMYTDAQFLQLNNSSGAKQSNKRATSVDKQNKSTIGKLSLPGIYRPDLNYNIDDYQTVSTYGPIKSGDLLTLIVQKIRPDNTYGVQKISKLLYQYNPGAFINGDINKLKVGYKINVPALDRPEFRKDSLAYLDGDGASNKKYASYIVKSQQKTGSSMTEQQAKSSVSSQNNANVNIYDKAELKLVVGEPGELDTTKLIETLEITDGSIKAQDILNLSIDKINVLKEENQTLREQFGLLMSRMDEVIQKNDMLDEELEKLKYPDLYKGIKQQNTDSTATIADKPEVEQLASLDNSAASINSEDKKIVITKQQASSIKNQVIIKKDKNAIDWLFWGVSLLVTALIALFALFAFVLAIRLKNNKKDIAPEEFSIDEAWSDNNVNEHLVDADKNDIAESTIPESTIPESTTDDEELTQSHTQVSRDKAGESLDFDFDESSQQLDDLDVQSLYENEKLAEEQLMGSVQQVKVSAVSTPQQDINAVANAGDDSFGINFNDILAPTKSVPSKDNVDLISQSSVYFAYGKFDLAEQLLNDGIAADPANLKLQLKLFECYAKMDDEIKFMTYLEQTRSLYSENDEFKSDINNIYQKQWDKELF
ncbi:MAG: hypothetical protein QM479_02525 [Pseudomonadota bacterium]